MYKQICSGASRRCLRGAFSMGEWLVSLKGEASSLEELRSAFNLARLNVRQEEGHYYLSSSEFDGSTDAADVLERASELVAVINAILKVRYGYSKGLAANNVVRVDDDGTLHNYVFLSGVMGASGGFHATLSGGTATSGPAEV